MKHAIKVVLLLAAIVTAAPASAENWPPEFPEGGDDRIYVDGSTAREDRITVWAPYSYGFHSDRELGVIWEWAEWGCSLYHRRPAAISHNANDALCDALDEAEAKRSGNCWHLHHFACAE